jgi:PhzF family phenazine biosynthesis protein
MGLRIVQVDAFTATPFTGNPAAVCILPEPRDERWMQQVASEMNLSETAFLVRRSDGFDLRWFTPVIEVALCGHATLASAHVLWEDGHLTPQESARFHTRSGLLTAARAGEWIELNFPAALLTTTTPPDGLAQALGVTPVFVGQYHTGFLAQLATDEQVRTLQPDFTALKKLPGARGVIVTSRSSSPQFDFISRYFAPQAGINEDPVTGSAHCCLGPYWGKLLQKDQLVAYQASARGGVVRLRLAGERVYLSGQAVTVWHGELL